MKSAFVAIIGRPSSGKSTLLNALCGQKVSIVSPVPQTTRNKVRGIVNKEGHGQIVFLDTPGMHLSDKKFNNLMMENVSSALSDADVILYIADASRAPGKEEEAVLDLMAKMTKPVIAVLNKTEVKPSFSLDFKLAVNAKFKAKAFLEISALEKKGLEPLLLEIFEAAPEGEAYYPVEYYTDQEPQFRMAEIIREQAINRVKEEVPHSIYVEIADTETSEDGKKLWIRAFLTVERETQKGILVGKGGEMIKTIRQAAQKELGKIFSQWIELDLRVKVNAKWRTKDLLIRSMLGGKKG